MGFSAIRSSMSDKLVEVIHSNVIRLLREERLKRRISITALAERAGLSQAMVSFVESESRKPTLDTLLRLTRALKVDLATIIRRATQAALHGRD